LTYHGFLKLNRDIIIASLSSLTSYFSITLDQWKNFNAIWYKRFLEKAKILLGPENFIILKKKVCFIFILQSRVTPNTLLCHLGELLLCSLGNHSIALNSGALFLLLVKVCLFWRRNWLCTFFLSLNKNLAHY
jgi:hypothetical protein